MVRRVTGAGGVTDEIADEAWDVLSAAGAGAALCAAVGFEPCGALWLLAGAIGDALGARRSFFPGDLPGPFSLGFFTE
ncbi:MAG: hypothetical protein U0638_00670 [Phycisphaerales bacterium]